jgi:hypothetical protein
MIASGPAFADYFEGVRRRTRDFFGAIPPDRIDWAPRAGEYTCGDIVRHVAASEAMFVGAAMDGVWRYAGHALADTRPSLEPGARPVRTRRLLLAMTEHEVHHRSQLASYLTWMGVEAPDIFSLGVEDVARLTAPAAGSHR